MKVAIISSASFQKINFAKLIPQNTTKVISSVPEHLNQSIVQYADVNRIRFVTKNLAECENKWQAIEQFCEQCDHIIALWGIINPFPFLSWTAYCIRKNWTILAG